MARREAVYSFTNSVTVQYVLRDIALLLYPFVQTFLTKEKNNFTYIYNSKIYVLLKYATKLKSLWSLHGS